MIAEPCNLLEISKIINFFENHILIINDKKFKS